MLRVIAFAAVLLPLAACDAPDPSAFPKHALRESSTGSHIPDAATSDSGVTTSNTHDIERLDQRGLGKPPGGS